MSIYHCNSFEFSADLWHLVDRGLRRFRVSSGISILHCEDTNPVGERRSHSLIIFDLDHTSKVVPVRKVRKKCECMLYRTLRTV
jgi:hypothetical protein